MISFPPKKSRSKWRLLIIIPIFLIGGMLLLTFWYQKSLQAPSSDNTQKVFVIQPEEAASSIAQRLQKEGLIKNSLAFRFYLRLSGQDSKLQTGDFKLRKNMTAQEIAESLNSGVVDKWITLLEGWRVEEIAKELKKKLSINETEFLKVAQEGYMFPDTYLVPVDATAADIAQILRNNFDKRLNSANLTPESGTKDLTFKEKIILASIIEREAKDGLEERSMIAGILLNRLNSGMALQVDATIQYDLGNNNNWWPTLTQEDYKIDSPSNTYTRPGLPPGPISNPGILSIQAAFNPIDTDFLYYIHAPDGKAYYAKTLDEHNENVARYLH